MRSVHPMTMLSLLVASSAAGCSFIDDFGRFSFPEDGASHLPFDASSADAGLDADLRMSDGSIVDAHVSVDADASSMRSDSGLRCEDVCVETSMECRGTSAVICRIGAEGCLEWGPEFVCESPPAAECVDSTLHDYRALGECASNRCTYAPIDVSCPRGCTGASCVFALDLYAKASNADPSDLFGAAVALSADGTTLAVGAYEETSASSGVGADQNSNTGDRNGAVYVFRRSAGGSWSQEAYIKASNTDPTDYFGNAIALSADGATLAVGAWGESSAARGIDGDQTNNAAMWSGAVYVFARNASGAWRQESYIKASNGDPGDRFGSAIALSADGNTLAAGAWGESSAAGGVNGNQDSNDSRHSGAVYVFRRSAGSWVQEAYVKSSNNGEGDYFGNAVALSANGSMLAVGARSEQTASRGIAGGAVYLFRRDGASWVSDARLTSSNTDENDNFGFSVTLSGDGTVLAVAARDEDSTARGVNGDQTINSAAGSNSGAVYVFRRTGGTWSQEAYVKASNPGENDRFGYAASLSADGTRLLISAPFEDSNARGSGGDQRSDAAIDSGAVYLFRSTAIGTWIQEAYLKAPNTGERDAFGSAIALSPDGAMLAVGAPEEDSIARGVNGDPENDSSRNSGAAYAFLIE